MMRTMKPLIAFNLVQTFFLVFFNSLTEGVLINDGLEEEARKRLARETLSLSVSSSESLSSLPSSSSSSSSSISLCYVENYLLIKSNTHKNAMA